MQRFKFDDIQSIAALMQKGGICVFPTDTVYGLGGVFDNPMVLPKIYGAKHRSAEKKIPFLVSDEAMIKAFLADEIPHDMHRLIQIFSPGGITYILPGKPSIRDFAADDGTVGVRIPNSPFLLNLIRTVGKPLLATSANISGQPDLHTMGEIERTFMNSIDGIVIGNQASSTIPSTIITFAEDLPRFLRVGSISKEDIRRYVQTKTFVLFVCTGNTCRSPLAEYYAKTKLNPRFYHIESAGTSAVDGMPISEHSARILKDNNIVFTKTAQQLTAFLASLSDVQLTLENNHKIYTERMFHNSQAFTLNEMALNHGSIGINGEISCGTIHQGSDIADPVGKEYMVYQQTFGEIAGAIDTITWADALPER